MLCLHHTGRRCAVPLRHGPEVGHYGPWVHVWPRATPAGLGRGASLLLDLADRDRLRTLPQSSAPHLAKPVVPAVVDDDRREMVRRQLAHLRRRRAPPVRKEDLALAYAARVDRQVARRRVRGVVLVLETQSEITER